LTTLLNGRLSLHDADDVEQMCWAVIYRSGLTLTETQKTELCTYLIETAWELSLKYEEGRGSTSSFIGFATTNLRLRTIDWLRREHGRSTWKFKSHTHTRERPKLVSLDTDAAVRDRLEHSLAAGPGDSETSWDEDDGGLFADRDREEAKDLAALGIHPRRRTAY
jgi:hypothetical protein